MRRRGSVLLIVIALMSICNMLLTSCASRNHMVEADNDMEIYVQASCIPIEYIVTGKYARKEKNDPDFPLFNTLILFPHYNTFVYQKSISFIGVTRPLNCRFMTGTYMNKNDTIICLSDVEYLEPDKGEKAYKTVIGDTLQMEHYLDTPIFWFKRISKEAVVELDPYVSDVDLLVELEPLKDTKGYIWTKEDYDFKSLSEDDRKQLLSPMDYNSDLLFKDDSKSKKNGPHLPVFYRVPFKVKSKEVMGLAGSTDFFKYYRPVKQ